MVTVLRGGRVITTAGQGVIERGVVVIRGARIAAVGPEGEVAAPQDADVIDVGGRTMLPGLIDLHTHVCMMSDAESTEGVNPRTVGESLLRGVDNIRRATATGVTTVRDVGCKHAGIFALRRAIDSGEMVGPRLLICGAAIAMTGGHGYNICSVEADGPDAVRAAARAQLKMGADLVKVMATGGAGTPNERINDCQLTVEEMAAAADEAHKREKTIAAHVGHAEGCLNALKAGIDTIEHGLYLDDIAIQAMVRSGATYVPTLEVYERLVRLGPKLVPPYAAAKAEPVVGPHRESFQRAIAAGVKIAAGTDSGAYFWRLGDLALEMERMVEFGFPPIEAIKAATRNGAEALRMLGRFGTLEAGKLADVVVVDGNPLDDMAAMRNVWLVMKEGEIQRSAVGSRQ